MLKESVETTIEDCERIVEYHTRLGWAAIDRWKARGKTSSAKSAAYHIYVARLMRCRYFVLMGIGDSKESDMPFPCEAGEENQ